MKMISRSLLVGAVLFSASAFALPGDNNNNTTVTVSVPADNAVKQKIGEAFEILMTANKNEISAARIALNRASRFKVKEFAKLMIQDHVQNLEDTRKISDAINISPMTSAKSAILKKKGENLLDQLNTAPTRRFDKIYMEAMVKDHQEVLNLIDNELLPNVSNPRLTAHLKATREKVADHLRMAKAILNSL